ncbi:MAG: HRDC domain-containing protein [Alphaproteobacteria bacterium]|nr:HRDC domain-containing protein [Alphaproteobacteria bacterium]MCB9691652.1 HRDC domain-containing protein [Alphaproteobacteria bacterium]
MTMLLTDPDALVVGDGPFAVDTEFHAENCYHPRLHLLQVRAPGAPAQLIDTHDARLMAALADRLVSRPWIVHAGRIDLPLLARALGSVPETVHDTQIAAGLVQTKYPAGLADLLERWCGVHLDKGETLSDWSRRPLTPGQITYAAQDVAHLHALWDALSSRAAELGRSEILAAACTEARDVAVAGPDDRDAWLQIPGARALDVPAAGILRRLAAWREDVARRSDRPAPTVLGNRVLLELARRAPVGDALLQGRRAPKRTLHAHADALQDAITGGPRDTVGIPGPIRAGSPEAARLAWWTAWAEALALAGGWSASLVIPPSDRDDLALGGPGPTGWRASLLGEDLPAARRGDRPLALPSTIP